MLRRHGRADGRSVKQCLAARLGVTRFRLRLFGENGTELQDDEIFTSPVKVHLILLDFWMEEQDQEIVSVAGENDLVALEKLLHSPQNPNVTDEQGKTPLHYAAQNGHGEAVKLLIEACAEKDAPDRELMTPLSWAAGQGHLDVVRLLLDVGAEKEQADVDGSTPLHYAAGEGALEIVRLLIELGADKDWPNTAFRSTPLHFASYNGH